jgi:hypothetical protein
MWECGKVRMWEGRPRRADFAPRSRDPACAGELALLRPAPAGLRRVAPYCDQVRSVLKA